jgi:hypothetical protein
MLHFGVRVVYKTQLLEDFREMIDELKNRVEPVVAKVKNGDLPTTNGISYLDVKLQVFPVRCAVVSLAGLFHRNCTIPRAACVSTWPRSLLFSIVC